MGRHLLRRGGTFYFHARVSVDVRSELGREILTYSLGTADRREAERIASQARAGQLQLEAHVRQHVAMDTAADLDIDALLALYVRRFTGNQDTDLVQPLRQAEFAREELARARQDYASGNLEDAERLADWVLSEAGIGGADYEQRMRLSRALLRARVDLWSEEAARMPALPTPSGSPEANPNAASGLRVSELAAAFLQHRDQTDPLPPTTRQHFVVALGALADLLGDPVLASVRNRDAQDAAAKMARLPVRWRSRFAGQPASALVDAGEGPRVPAGTVKKELALCRAFWNWAVLREELQRNAFDAVKPPDTGNAKDKRRPFTTDELDLLRPMVAAWRVKYPGRYWTVLLCAATGARLSEIALRRWEDFRHDPDGWAFHIHGDVKTDSSERWLPVPEWIIQRAGSTPAGFLEVLFGERQVLGDDGAPAISKAFAKLIDKLPATDRRKLGLHSLRHGMVDALRQAGVDPDLRREILGHAATDVEGSTYGSVAPLAMKRDALERVTAAL